MMQFETRANGTEMRARDVPAGVVHDLGNLIQIATSAVNILARNPSLQDNAVIAGAQASLRQAGALVRQTMGAGRTQERSVELVNVAACFAEVEALVRIAWDSRFRLRVRAPEGLPPVLCDPIGLQNAVLNLLLNARDAMPNGGDVGLAAMSHDGAVEICVADNGIGMSAETIERALDPYFTTKPDGLGGVGLPMVDRFARDAGGSVVIESVPGVGTIVMLHLPSARETVQNEDQ